MSNQALKTTPELSHEDLLSQIMGKLNEMDQKLVAVDERLEEGDKLFKKLAESVGHAQGSAALAVNYLRVIAKRLQADEEIRQVIREDLDTMPAPPPSPSDRPPELTQGPMGGEE